MAPPGPGSARKGAETVVPSVGGPTWSVIHNLAENSSLSRDGKAAVAQLLDRLEARLGESWPRRLHDKRGRLYPELLLFSSHVAVLLLDAVIRDDGNCGEDADDHDDDEELDDRLPLGDEGRDCRSELLAVPPLKDVAALLGAGAGWRVEMELAPSSLDRGASGSFDQLEAVAAST